MLRVLTYHRVAEPSHAPWLDPSLISATPAAFEQQVRHLAENYAVVSARDVLEAAGGGRPLPERAVLLTFDDAYRDFGEVAWPILRRYALPATLFVPTAYPDHPEREFWWDRLYRAVTGTSLTECRVGPREALPLGTPAARAASLRRLRNHIKTLPHADAMALLEQLCDELEVTATRAAVLTWAELRKLAREGVTLGAHTQTHPLLTQVPPEQAREEIRGSLADLRRSVGEALPLFCYPDGAHDETTVRILRQEGFQLAFTTLDGQNNLRWVDPLRLRRTNITPRTSLVIFRLRLHPLFAYMDMWRHRKRHGAQSGGCGRRAVNCLPQSPSVNRPARLKVAYVMSRFPKLTETFVLYEILALRALGVEVAIFPLLRQRQPVGHPEVAQLVREAHFHPFVSWPILRANWQFLRRLGANYFRVWFEVLRKTLGSANFFFGALGIFPKVVRFAQEMQEQGITHVHAHFANHPALAAYLIHRLTGIPYSFTAHGSDLHVERRMLDSKVEAAAFVVAISNFNRDVILRECSERVREKVRVIHCGVDAKVFLPRPRRSDSDLFRILCVASFEEVKGHAFLVEACRILRARGVPFECHLVGDGPLRSRIEAQIAHAGLNHHIRVHGALPRPQVVQHLAEADVAALASVPTRNGKREGIPVVLMEAMASGLPVVASAISGIPELVESGRTGTLVPPGDPAALAEALQCLAGDREMCQRFGRAGREKVLSEFDLRTNTLKLLELFVGGRRCDGLPERGKPAISQPHSLVGIERLKDSSLARTE